MSSYKNLESLVEKYIHKFEELSLVIESVQQGRDEYNDLYFSSQEKLEAAERERDELREQFDKLASAAGWSKEQCEQTGVSPFDVVEDLVSAKRELDDLRLRDCHQCGEILQLAGALNKAEAELARRDAAAGEPVAWQYRYNDGKVGDWHTVDSESECNHLPCYERRPIYTAAPPAVLPPEMINADAPCHYSSEETFAWVAGANWMRQQCLELGAQQQQVVELPAVRKSDDVVYGGSGAFTMGKNSGFNECLAIVTSSLDAANVKWEVKS